MPIRIVQGWASTSAEPSVGAQLFYGRMLIASGIEHVAREE